MADDPRIANTITASVPGRHYWFARNSQSITFLIAVVALVGGYLAFTIPISAEEAMIQAGRRRLRPIFMTALATIAGMLPLGFALGAGSQMLQPRAIVVIDGVLVSTVRSLIVTPAIFFYSKRRTF